MLEREINALTALAQRASKPLRPGARCRWWICSSASVGRGKPVLSRDGPRARCRGIPQGSFIARGYAAKAPCRQGTAADRTLGVRYQPMTASHLVTRGWAGKPSCGTVRRSLATGEEQPEVLKYLVILPIQNRVPNSTLTSSRSIIPTQNHPNQDYFCQIWFRFSKLLS